ncbi:MAG: hypothetical protein NTZ90_11330 [Proteobacteria bacterium]|nr:hypothetical protein [Pseudomonadota bacterium]
MRLAYVGALVVVAALINGCGKKDKDYSGTAGICTQTETISAGQTLIYCTEYTWKEKTKSDPSKDVAKSISDGCGPNTSTATYVYSATGTCSETGAVGKCAFSSTTSGATVSAKIVMSGTAATQDLSTQFCSAVSGTYTKI